MTDRLHARTAPTLDSVISAHAALRSRNPLVQCLTNVVSSNFMANVLLSAGAAPAMVDNPEEAAAFARIAGAVLINLGTPTRAQVESMRLAVAAAHDAGRPWVLDPIGAGGLPWRGAVAAQLLAFKPAVIRGNASEIIGLAGLGSDARASTAPTILPRRSGRPCSCWRTPGRCRHPARSITSSGGSTVRRGWSKWRAAVPGCRRSPLPAARWGRWLPLTPPWSTIT